MDWGRVGEDVLVVAAAAASWAGIAALRGRRRGGGTGAASTGAAGFVSSAGTAPAPSAPLAPPSAAAGAAPSERVVPRARLTAVAPDRLPTFAAVGGMEDVKKEMRDTFGLVLAHTKEADAYRIEWNGLLLHGPPGVGKSFFARALAGEFGLNLVAVSTGDLVSDRIGAGPRLVEEAFAFARAHEPALLFFDEFDAVAQRRHQGDVSSSTDVLFQLLQSLEETRSDRRLLVVAATNEVDDLDAAVIRPGRFDRRIRLDLPDVDARRAIFKVALGGRPVAKEIDVVELAERSRGRTPATLVAAVESAALGAFRKAAGTGRIVRIAQADVLDALEHAGGHDRPTIEQWSWKRIVLAPPIAAELQELQALLEDPDRCRQYGIDAPTGVLLTGPPGTGKTTIAKVLAAEARCSFYPVSGADVTSRWVGESEQLIARLFRRARDNAPSIVFIDEIDAISSARGELGAYDRQLDQLLQEIDGMAGQDRVLVIGATNRPDRIDRALLRGGRLSRMIEVPLPDADARLAILELLTMSMPLHGVDLQDLALETEGFAGADLKALCQQAALEAMVRAGGGHAGTTGHAGGGHAGATGHSPSITAADVAKALAVETETVGRNSQPVAPRRRPLRAGD